jgi:hypothetical protein
VAVGTEGDLTSYNQSTPQVRGSWVSWASHRFPLDGYPVPTPNIATVVHLNTAGHPDRTMTVPVAVDVKRPRFHAASF